MTTILTPWDRVRAHDEFYIGATLYAISSLWDEAWTEDTTAPRFTIPMLRVIFPDGVPVIQPDKPKEVRCVVERSDSPRHAWIKAGSLNFYDWIISRTEPGKTYDLVLTEREEK